MDITSYLLGKQAGGGGKTTPTKGIVFDEWDEDGYPTKADIYGLTSIPRYYMSASSSTNYNYLFKNMKNIIFHSNVNTIGEMSFSNLKKLETIDISKVTSFDIFAFIGCEKLKNIEFNNTITSLPQGLFENCTVLDLKEIPDSVTSIGNECFYLCKNVEFKKLPSSLTTLGTRAFYGCLKADIQQIPDSITSIGERTFQGIASKKMSMNNVTSLSATNSSQAIFSGENLKQVWIGSAITSNGFGRYVFYNCTALEKIYINLPRATVETFTNYQYAFMNDTSKTGIIVCNDDEGFITKQEFDNQIIE